MTTSRLPRLPKQEAPDYDGDPQEWIRVECGECSRSVECSRSDAVTGCFGSLDEYGWQIERDPETGRVLATCSGCRESDYHDGDGERDA